MVIKTCARCGSELIEGAKFCTECGNRIINENDIVLKDVVIPEENSENREITEPTEEKTDVNATPGEVASEPAAKPAAERVENPYGAANGEINGAYSPYGEGGRNPYSAPYGANPNVGGNPYANPYANNPNAGANPYTNPYSNTPNNGANPYANPYANNPNAGASPYASPYGNNPNAAANPYGNANANGGYNGGNGAPYNPSPYQNTGRNPSNPRTLNIGALVFSIINLVVFSCCCTGVIFGVAGIIFTVMAKNALTDEDEARYVKLAYILNVVGVVLGIICIAVSIMVGGSIDPESMESALRLFNIRK